MLKWPEIWQQIKVFSINPDFKGTDQIIVSGGNSGRGSQHRKTNGGCDWISDGGANKGAVHTLLGPRCSLPYLPNATTHTSCYNIFTAQTPIGERVSS